MSTVIDFNNNLNIDSSILTFGNFDGVHIGHLNLIDTLVSKANEKRLKSVLITFNPHTRSIINNEKINILTPHSEKINLLQKTNLDYIATIDFNESFSKILKNDFIDLLLEKYNPKIIVLGYDNRFGYKGLGDYRFLCDYLSNHQIQIIKYNPYKKYSKIAKSSLVKKLILNGDIRKANKFLGRLYTLYGSIVEGKKEGRKIGFPTANLKISDIQQIIPKVGVYSVNFKIGQATHNALCNIGYRPTFEINGNLSIESYIVDSDEFNFYGNEVSIEFKDFIREEKKFTNKEELIKQIETDLKFSFVK
tara:strand:- start:1253 stop:2170 length:918 start_codon:yes stop_codon:yes gene_type:complete